MTEANKDLLLQSIKTIRQLSDKLAAYEQRERSDIAIVGIACRFPGGVDSVSSYWDLLSAGRSGVVEVGADRWSNRQFVDPDYSASGKLVTPYAGMLEKIYDFDAEFFGMSAVEAENLDPQQRMLLEQSWMALEDAGFDIGGLRGSGRGGERQSRRQGHRESSPHGGGGPCEAWWRGTIGITRPCPSTTLRVVLLPVPGRNKP